MTHGLAIDRATRVSGSVCGGRYYGTLGPAETHLWRSPDVALSSVTDFRKGVVGDQQHAWQATLNGTAVVFTTHPGPDMDPSGAKSDYSDGYWTGSASLPRIGQFETVALILYRPPPSIYSQPALREMLFPFDYTHVSRICMLCSSSSSSCSISIFTSSFWLFLLFVLLFFLFFLLLVFFVPFIRFCLLRQHLLPMLLSCHLPRACVIYLQAGFDRTQFDELQDQLSTAQRIAGRVGNGYVALFSASTPGTVTWATKPSNCTGSHCSYNVGREILASTDGAGRGAWACVVGNAATHGSFKNFTAKVLAPAVFSHTADDKMATKLSWPGGSTFEMAWEGAMTMTKTSSATSGMSNGDEEHSVVDVPLASHMRYDNPYTQHGPVPFPLRGGVSFTYDEQVLELDFDQGIRRTLAYRGPTRR